MKMQVPDGNLSDQDTAFEDKHLRHLKMESEFMS